MRLFESARQAPLFAVFLCLGALIGTVYDILYVLRIGRIVHIADFLFVVFCFASFSAFTYIFNSGEVCFYFFIAMIPGFFAERLTLGFFIKNLIDFFAKILYNLTVGFDMKSKLAKLKK